MISCQGKKLSKRIKAHMKSRQEWSKDGNFQPIGQRTVSKAIAKSKSRTLTNLLLSLLVLSQRLKVLHFVQVSNLLSSIFIISWNDDGVLDSGVIIVGEQRWAGPSVCPSSKRHPCGGQPPTRCQRTATTAWLFLDCQHSPPRTT